MRSAVVPLVVQDVMVKSVMALTETQTQSPKCGTTDDPMNCSIVEGYTLTVNVAISDDSGETIQTLTMAQPASLTTQASFAAASDNKSGTFTFTPSFGDGQ